MQRQLRHTNPNTTASYLRSLGYEEEHGQKALAAIEGRGPAKPLSFAETVERKRPSDAHHQKARYTVPVHSAGGN